MDAWLIVVVVVGFAVWAVTAIRPPDDHQIEAMAVMYRIPVSPPVIERLRDRVTLLRRWRLGGALFGVGVGGVVAAATSVDVSVNALLFSLAVGYGVASIAVELVDSRRPTRATTAMASPRRRDARSLVGNWAALPCAVATVLVAGAIVVNLVWRPGSDLPGEPAPLSTATVALLTVGYLAVLTVAGLALAAVARAPERASDPAHLVVIRASRLVAAMTIVGATWMVVGVLGSTAMRPLWGVRPDNGGLSFLLLVATMYVALSGMMGFISTVSTLPRNRPFRRQPSTIGSRPREQGAR